MQTNDQLDILEDEITALLREHVLGKSAEGAAAPATVGVKRKHPGGAILSWAIGSLLFGFWCYWWLLESRGLADAEVIPHILRVTGLSQHGLDLHRMNHAGEPAGPVVVAASNQIWKVSGSDYDLVMRKLSAIAYQAGGNPEREWFYPDGRVVLQAGWAEQAEGRPAIPILAAHLALMAKVLDGETEATARSEVLRDYGESVTAENRGFLLKQVVRAVDGDGVKYWIDDGGFLSQSPLGQTP